MKRSIGIICIILGAVLIMATLFLMFENTVEDKNAEVSSNKVLEKMENIIFAKTEENENNTSVDFLDGNVIKLDKNRYLGFIFFPKLNIKLPVMTENSYAGLKIAPCRQFGSLETDNLVIAGHNYKSHFGKLPYLKYGDDVIFTDTNGKIYNYKVEIVDVISPADVENVLHGNWELRLYTCTYSGKMRYLICCKLKDTGIYTTPDS